MAEKLYTPKQVAEHYQVSLAAVRAWILYRKIGFTKIGAAVRISESDLKAFERREEAVK